MFLGAVRAVLVALALCFLALVLNVLDYPTFLGCVFVGLAVFLAGFVTANRPGSGAALITGFSAAILTMLSSFVLYRLAAGGGDSELEYLTYTLLIRSATLLVLLPLATALVTAVLEKLRIDRYP